MDIYNYFKEEDTLKKIVLLVFLIFFINIGYANQFYPVERAVLNELIISNNLIQPGSGNPITLDNSYDLENFYINGTSVSTIETEGNCNPCRIVSIDFTNFNITSIPESFSQLVLLKSLTLKNNNIEDLPLSLYSLNYIEQFDISFNQISQLDEGIGSFSELNDLNISANYINELPQSISSLTGLTDLDVSQNNLTEFNLNNLDNLENLYIGGNYISNLDESFCEININWANHDNIVMNNHLCSNIPSCLVETNSVGPQNCNEGQRQFLQFIINLNQLDEYSSVNDNDNSDSEFKPIELGYQRWELGQIIELNLSSNPYNNIDYDYNLSYFPNDLTEVTSLQYLDLGNNQLTDIPSSIGLLTDLISLKYDNNFISGNLSSGGIPTQIGLLSNLEVLSLAYNFISIPNSAIYSLTNLNELYLNNNQIYYIDNDLGNLEQLNILKLNNNQISTIPNEIRFLDSLIDLDLSSNQLITFNDNLHYLEELKYLDLGNNSIQEIPSTIEQMISLHEIKLNNNQLTSIPDEIYDLFDLEKLHLQYNSLVTLQNEFGGLVNLQELKLHYNQLHELPSSICSIDIFNLAESVNEINNYLTFHQNYFCFNLPSCIANHEQTDEIIGEQDCYGSDIQVLTELIELNGIQGTNPASLGVWENQRLVELDMSGQAIDVLPEDLGYLAELRNLNLSNNSIDIIPNSIAYLVKLDSLNLSNNSISAIPEEFFGLEQILFLDLSDNFLTEYPSSINELITLTKLDLSSNQISVIAEEINNLENLYFFDISENLLDTIPNEIGALVSLNELYISNNSLVSIPNEIGNLFSLSSLIINNNNLDHIPPVFNQLTNLKDLNISNNNIVELQDNFFESSNLETVNLSSNRLLRLPNSICNANSVEIELSDNFLYCNLASDGNAFYGFMDELMVPDCIGENINGLNSENQGCEYYGCTESGQSSEFGEALNYNENAIMSCSQDGTYENLNDCCLYVQGPNIYVRPSDAGINPGSDVSGNGTEELPFESIELAIRLASPDDTVIVDDGEYVESVNIESKDGITIVSKEYYQNNVNSDNEYLENTIINGNNYGSCFNIINSGNSSKIRIYGFKCKNGRNDYGGGLSINNSKVIIDNIILTENIGTVNGGGVFVGGLSAVEINNTLIDTNISLIGTGYGGGVYVGNNSTISLKNTEISRNKSNRGGGIYLDNNQQVIFEKCKINKNHAIHKGGGIFNTNDLLYFDYIDSLSAVNNAESDTIVTIIEENISRNGAGIYQLNNSSNLEGVIIRKNNADENGGGIYVDIGNNNSQYSNLIITENTAQLGGGIYIEEADLKLYHITFYENYFNNGTSLNEGSAIFINQSSEIDIVNSILWNTTFENIINDIDESSILNISYSILSSEYIESNSTIKYSNPEFSNLTNFGLSRVSIALGNGMVDENIPEKDIFDNERPLSIYNNESPDIGATEELDLDYIQYYDWFVDPIGNDSDDGLNPNSPMRSINNAINHSLNGDRIYIKSGTYYENIVFNGKNVKLMNFVYHSEFGTTECVDDISQSDIENLIIASESEIIDLPVIQIMSGEDDVELCGFTIKGGQANNGAGIYIVDSNPTITHINISDNYSYNNGGGIFGDNFNGELNDLKISKNKSARDGAGIYLINSSPSMRDLTILENVAFEGNNNLDGAGIHLNNSNIDVFESLQFNRNNASRNGAGLYMINSSISNAFDIDFNENESFKNGGAIYLENSNLNFIDSSITNIFGNNAVLDGGGIYIKSSQIDGSNLNISENSADKDGGAIFIDEGGEIVLKNSDLINNSASEDGGAINLNGYNTNLQLESCKIYDNHSETSAILYSNNGQVVFRNTLIKGNSSNRYPGGLLAKNSNVSLVNITLTDNTVGEPGAGGNINIEKNSNLDLVNSILWNNDGTEIYLREEISFPKSIRVAYSLLDNGREGIFSSLIDSVYYEDNISEDPKFISPEEGFFYITKESPCVDKGIHFFYGINGEVIIDLQPSEYIGDAPDMGAFEKNVLTVFPGDLNNDGEVNTLDVLNIVKYFHKTGIPRYMKGVLWSQDGHGAISWDDYGSISGDTLTYSDANGDGIINEKDVLGIALNWGNTHLVNNPELAVIIDENDIKQNSSAELLLIYNSLSGSGEGFNEIKSYLEYLLDIVGLPAIYSLSQNYPNPFNPNTEINFSLPRNSFVSMYIYNIKGELIDNLITNTYYQTGYHRIKFDASNLSSGIYFYNIKTVNWEQTKKMMLVK